jgi:hypothetical protein
MPVILQALSLFIARLRFFEYHPIAPDLAELCGLRPATSPLRSELDPLS